MSYREDVGLVESCRVCGYPIRRPDVDPGPALCSQKCEREWRADVVDGEQ